MLCACALVPVPQMYAHRVLTLLHTKLMTMCEQADADNGTSGGAASHG